MREGYLAVTLLLPEPTVVQAVMIRKWRFFVPRLLAHCAYAARRATENHHFPLNLTCMAIGPRQPSPDRINGAGRCGYHDHNVSRNASCGLSARERKMSKFIVASAARNFIVTFGVSGGRCGQYTPWTKMATCLMLTASVILQSCAALPSSGPTARRILHAEKSEENILGYKVINIDSPTMAALSTAPLRKPNTDGGGLARLNLPAPANAIAPGDMLQISIYEVGITLFGGAANFGPPASPLSPTTAKPAAQLSGVVVAPDGTIQLPYVGRLQVSGKNPYEVQRLIEAGLRGKSQSPQAVVSIVDSIKSSVYISGSVKSPGRIYLGSANQTVLDLIAAAGGPVQPSVDTVVRLTRNGRSAEERLTEIATGSIDDLVALPGDKIELLTDVRTFSVFGATKVSQVPFDAENVSLAEAVARVGGPSDSQADPSAIFLFRYGTHVEGESDTPVIYRLNLMRPESYFLAQRFMMHDKDVIYIANSASNPPTKFISILNQLFSPVVTARVLTKTN